MRATVMKTLLIALATLWGATLSSQDRFIGAWRLAWLEEEGADGKVHRVDVTGMLVFTRDGHMSVQVMYRNPQAGTPAGPVQYAQGGYEASFGRYEIDERAHTFTYHVEGALVRSLIGKDLTRLFELSDKQLIVKSASPNEHWRVAWEHVQMATASQDSQRVTITRSGSQPSTKGPAEYFTGSVRVDPLFQPRGAARASGARVTFEPGARTAWHTHPLGQILIVTAGTGRVQQWGGQIEEMREGDVVWIPPGQKHWHGAAPTSAVTHIATQEQLDGNVVDWMEQVNDEQYRAR